MQTLIERYRSQLIGKRLSYQWRGYGSAICFEFGEIHERATTSGGSSELSGEFGVMIQWSWRIEKDNSILCGSWSDEALWEPAFSCLTDAVATELELFGEIPEITITLSSGHRIVSFMTSDGDPQWTLFDRSCKPDRWFHVHQGELQEGVAMTDYDARQFNLMTEALSAFERGALSLGGLVSTLEALESVLEEPDTRWHNSFLKQWGILEDVYAHMSDKNLEAVPASHIVLLQKAIEEIGRLVAQFSRRDSL